MDVEGKLIYVLSDMERSGVKIDTEVLKDLSMPIDAMLLTLPRNLSPLRNGVNHGLGL